MTFFKCFPLLLKNQTLQDTENSPTTSANLKSDKANFTPQETRGKTKATKSCSPPLPPPEPTSEGRDSGKEKAGPTSLPLGKLFWKKVSLSVRCLQGPWGPEVAQELFQVGQMDVDDSQRLSSSSSSMIQLVTEWRTPNVLLGGMRCRSCCTQVLCGGETETNE